MKIKTEHYNYLLEAIKPLVPKAQAHKEYLIKLNKPEMDQKKRLRWDLLYATVLSSWICDNLYKYLNDDHIDTALKNIMIELEIE